MARTHQSYSDELLANALAVGMTVAAAARAAGVSERSAYRRKKQPAVRARIAEVRRAALDTASGKLHQGMLSACDTLTGLIGHANPHVQIRAAQTVIQLALKVRQEVDAADRLDQLGSVGPALADERSRPVALSPPPGPALPTDLPRPPVRPIPDDVDAFSSGAGQPPVRPVHETGGVGLPAAEVHPDGARGSDRSRPVPLTAVGAVACVLLILAGVSFAVSRTTQAQTRREIADAADSRQTCQNLPEPVIHHPAPLPGSGDGLLNAGRFERTDGMNFGGRERPGSSDCEAFLSPNLSPRVSCPDGGAHSSTRADFGPISQVTPRGPGQGLRPEGAHAHQDRHGPVRQVL